MRQTNTLARASTYEAIGSRFSEIWIGMALNPAWAEITRRWSNDPKTVEDCQELPILPNDVAKYAWECAPHGSRLAV